MGPRKPMRAESSEESLKELGRHSYRSFLSLALNVRGYTAAGTMRKRASQNPRQVSAQSTTASLQQHRTWVRSECAEVQGLVSLPPTCERVAPILAASDASSHPSQPSRSWAPRSSAR